MSNHVRRPGAHVCGRGHETEFAVVVKPTADELKHAAERGGDVEERTICPVCAEPTMLKIVRDRIMGSVGGMR